MRSVLQKRDAEELKVWQCEGFRCILIEPVESECQRERRKVSKLWMMQLIKFLQVPLRESFKRGQACLEPYQWVDGGIQCRGNGLSVLVEAPRRFGARFGGYALSFYGNDWSSGAS